MSKNSGSLLNIIGADCVFDGTITAKHSIRIDGTFRGKIQTHGTITIGESGIVEAEIKAQNALVFGSVVGNMFVDDRIEFHTSAEVRGDIRAKELVIKEGVSFNGNCSMDPENGKHNQHQQQQQQEEKKGAQIVARES